MLHALYFAPHVPSAASVSRSAATIPAGAVGHSPNAPRPAALRFQRQRPFPDTSVPTTHRIRRYIPTGPDSFRIRPLPPLQGDRTARRHRIGKHGNRPVAPPFRKLRHIFLRQEYMRRPSAATARPSGTKTPRYPPACCRTVENRSAGSQALSGRNIPCTRRGCRPSAYLHRRTPVIRGPAPNAGTIHPVPDSRPPPRQYAPTKYPEMARTFGTQPTPPIPRSSRLPRNGGSRRSPVGRCKQAPPPRPPSPERRSRQTSDVTRPKKNRAGFIRTGPMLLSCRTADIFHTIWRTKPPSDR